MVAAQMKGKSRGLRPELREGRGTQSQLRPDLGFVPSVDIVSFIYLNLDVDN